MLPSTTSYIFVLQSLHKVLPTSSHYILLSTIKLAQNTSHPVVPCTTKLLHKKHFYTHRNLLQTEALTHRSFYTEKLLHREVFYTQHAFYTQTTFTHRSFYTETLLHKEAFTRKTFHTEKLSRTQWQEKLQLQNRISVPQRKKDDFEALFKRTFERNMSSAKNPTTDTSKASP